MTYNIDYSKWDNIDTSSESGDDFKRKPLVTKFEEGKRITFGGPSGNDAIRISDSAEVLSAEEIPEVHPPAQEIPEGNKESLCENGGVTDRYIWSQTRHDIVAYVFVPNDTAAKDMRINLKEESIEVKIGQNVLLCGELRHKVITDEDTWLWELLNIPATNSDTETQRCVKVDLKKLIEFDGVFVWWRGFLKGDKDIDITSLPARAAASSTEFRSRWDEAHELFKQSLNNKIASGELPISLDF